MNKNSVRSFLCELKTQNLRKHFLFEVKYNKMNQFLAFFLTKEGFFRGYFFKKQKNSKRMKIVIILKYDEKNQASFIFNKNKAVLINKTQFKKRKNLMKCCNGLGIVLVYTIKSFVSNEIAFWLRLGGKKIVEMM